MCPDRTRRVAAWHLESRPGGGTIKIQGRLSGGLAGDAAPLLTLNDGQSVRGKMEFRGWREGGGHSKDLEGVQFPLNHQHVAEFSRLKGRWRRKNFQ